MLYTAMTPNNVVRAEVVASIIEDCMSIGATKAKGVDGGSP